MKKIPTLFERDWAGDRSRVTRQVHAGCEWVIAGEGIPTIKIDGASCLMRDGRLYKRREIKSGQPTPEGFEPSESDAETQKVVGWVPVGDGPEDKWHREAFDATLPNGTYELMGPAIQRNTINLSRHQLIRHSISELGLPDVERTFDKIRAYLDAAQIEGIVWHHPDGRMAKIKSRDFGIKWPKEK